MYLEDTDTQALEKLASLVERRGLTMCQNLLAEENWEESWKDNYPPVELGKSLVILPYWLEDTYAGDRIPVILDPGLTFGTGSHPSTQMVIEAMEETVKAGDNCLDLGSGSGILSTTALRLGAKQAVGVDIDPKAEDMARENAAANGYGSEKFTALTGDVTADSALMARLAGKYDLVFVNIVADVIIHLAPVLPKFLSADSTLICSGILDSRLEDVKEALNRAGIDPIRVCAREDWRCIIAKRRLQ